MSNQLAALPLYLAWQSIVPQNSPEIVIADVGQTLPHSLTMLPRGYTIYPDFGVAYKLYRVGKNWNDARKHCIKDGAYLALTDSVDKVKDVKSLSEGLTGIWIGYHRLFNISEWVDVKTGLTATSIPWDGTPQVSDQSRKCIVINSSGDGTQAENCEVVYYFVCEIPIQWEPKHW